MEEKFRRVVLIKREMLQGWGDIREERNSKSWRQREKERE